MSIRVMVVDDSNTMRKIIVRSLNALGVHDVVEADDGLEALRLFKESEVQLVMLDWNMPQMNGIDVLKKIRAEGSKVPVMMVTTEAERGSVMEALQAGVTDYLVKPFTTEIIREKIEKNCALAT